MSDLDIKKLFAGFETEPQPAFTDSLRRRMIEEAGSAFPISAERPTERVDAVALALSPRSRRRRPVALAAAAAIVMVALGVAFRPWVDDRPARVDAGPAAPSPGNTVRAPTDPAGVAVGLWPVLTEAEVAAYPEDGPFRDPVATAREFARVYLGIEEQAAFPPRRTGLRVGLMVVPIGPSQRGGGRPLEDPEPASLVSVSLSEGRLWTVVAANAPRIVPGYHYSERSWYSPTIRVDGEANAFEGTIDVEVREAGMVAGQALGRGFVTTSGASDGSLGPFAGEITIAEPTGRRGAVLLSEHSAEDGRLLQVTVVGITFDRPADPSVRSPS